MRKRTRTNLHHKNQSSYQLEKLHKKISLTNSSFVHFQDEPYDYDATLAHSSNDDKGKSSLEPLKITHKSLEEKPKINRAIILESLNHKESLKKISTLKKADTLNENPIFSKNLQKTYTISAYKLRQKPSQADEEWLIDLSQLEFELSNDLNNLSESEDDYYCKYHNVYKTIFEKLISIDKNFGDLLKKILQGYEDFFLHHQNLIDKVLKQCEEKLNAEIAENKRLQKEVDAIRADNRNLLKALSLRNEEFSAFISRNKNLTADEIEKIMDEHKTMTSSLNLAQNEIRFLKLKETKYQKLLQAAELLGFSWSENHKELINDLSTYSDIDLQQLISRSSSNILQLPQSHELSLSGSSPCGRNVSFDISPIPPDSSSKLSDPWLIKYV
ncbi:unnamed protein product [Blepharisma stoltei]|uniref:Translin-associated factor X-interacting protein 1 N-terminal domain-containing protein n=1 Tax=Blepharisma stoltei TaxID=1481888 RepID=A0AAU9JKS0_9CILI|nr:unnamed protein product [Blepharisma stoltei]